MVGRVDARRRLLALPYLACKLKNKGDLVLSITSSTSTLGR
jgi:hypothetical protein